MTLRQWLPTQGNGALANLLKRRVLNNYREYCGGVCNRRALLSYLVLPLTPPRSLRDRVLFSNRGIAQEIPRALNELGYVVDIVNYDNRSWRPELPYDLFIGHGGVNFDRIAARLPVDCVKIYFSTGIHWREGNLREAKAFHELAVRRGILLPPDRFNAHPEESANQNADGIICLGNRNAAATFARFPTVIAINNAAYPTQWAGWREKDFAAGRSHFLFFSGRGNVHKGLDRLLEAFVGAPYQLHVCQHIEVDFGRAYQAELYAQPNIHVHNFVKMRSPLFYELARCCDWVILPTCAEGQPGSVIECMMHGLVPILPDAANIDLEDWGLELPDTSVEAIVDVAQRAAQMEPDEIRRRTARVVDCAQNDYSVARFQVSIKRAIEQIVAARGQV